MNRKEFLEILRSQLAGQMQEGKAAAHIRYYEDYIQSQVRGGRSEQEVLQELGDPQGPENTSSTFCQPSGYLLPNHLM